MSKIRIKKSELKNTIRTHIRQRLREALSSGMSAADLGTYMKMGLPASAEVVSWSGDEDRATFMVKVSPESGELPFGSAEDVLLRDFPPTTFEVSITKKTIDHGMSEDEGAY